LSYQAEYKPADWQKVAMGPMMAGVFVATADNAGQLSFVRESTAVAAAILDAAESSDDELVASVAVYWRDGGARPSLPEDYHTAQGRAVLLEAVAEADALAGASHPESLPAYRLWCLECGFVAARAHHEGEGPESVTDAERVAFAELAAALHITR
jgi:hypothetical protein